MQAPISSTEWTLSLYRMPRTDMYFRISSNQSIEGDTLLNSPRFRDDIQPQNIESCYQLNSLYKK